MCGGGGGAVWTGVPGVRPEPRRRKAGARGCAGGGGRGSRTTAMKYICLFFFFGSCGVVWVFAWLVCFFSRGRKERIVTLSGTI